MEIQIPYKYTPRDYQKPLYNAIGNGIKRAVVVWHRRAGKDKTCFNIMVKEAFKRKGTYFYFLPEYSQAKKVIWDNIDNDGFKMLDHIPPEIIKNTNATELKVELKNGSVIQLMGADSFEKSGVGTNPVGVVFSEYSINSPKVWNYVRPILIANDGWVIFNFTPRGTNHAYEILQYAKESEKWFDQVLTVDDTDVLTEEQLQEERDSMPEDLFNQEYYCKFLEGAGSFFRNIESNVYAGKPDKIDATHRYQIGVDLAKYQDYTVITPIDLSTFYVGEIERFNQLDYTTQKIKIEATYLRYKADRNPIMWMDSTGVGDPIVEDLENKGVEIQPFQFTEPSRKDLLTNLQIVLEQNKIRIPNDERLIAELKSMQYVLTDRGKLKIQVPEGMHDDCFVKGTAILTDKGQKPIETIKEGDLVLTREGYKPVVMTRAKKKRVIKNLGLKGTPDHPVILADDTQKELSKVSKDDTLHVWNSSKQKVEKLSYTKAKNIIDTQNLQENSTEHISGDMISGNNPQYHYIGKYGKTTMVKYLRAMLFTIRTKINKITESKTWKYLLSQNIVNTICNYAQRAGKVFVTCVKKILSTKVLGKLISVLPYVGEEKEMVYNLQVSECNEYFANSILVHNCIMSLALAVWELPQHTYTPNQPGIRYLKRPTANTRGVNVVDSYE